MKEVDDSLFQCPYCSSTLNIKSKDHIFPQFLGGTRKVDCCQECNSFFGHTFEAKSSIALQSLHIYISGWGLKMIDLNTVWKSAYMMDGQSYNLQVGKNGLKVELAKPYIEYNKENQIIGGVFPNMKLVNQLVRSLNHKKYVKDIKIEAESLAKMDLVGLEHVITLGPDIKKTALKMCINLCTLLPDFNLSEIDDSKIYFSQTFNGVSIRGVIPEYNTLEDIDEHREALSHVIYVERGEHFISGLVQFFGVIQLFCHIGKSKKDSKPIAMLASLDPLTGKEQFKTLTPIKLKTPPFSILLAEYILQVQKWYDKFRTEAIKRKATHPPNLKISGIEIEKF